MKHTIQIPLRGKIVQLLLRAPDGHAAFTASLCLDTSFAMTPRTFHHGQPVTLDASLDLRPKPANLTMPDFEAQIGKPATSHVDACPASTML